ncbi:MAG: outer membrane protein transport protein [Verrucomicrobiota bacterium]
MNRVVSIILLASFSLTGFSAEGLRTLPDTAEAMGMVGGRLAVLDDGSVTRTNPATLADHSETLVQITFQPWHGKTDFVNGNGVTNSMTDPWKPLGSAYFVTPIKEDLTFGFGFSAPFGVSISYPSTGPFRYFGAHEANLQTIALNPALGLKINDDVSIGVGLDIFRSSLMLKQNFPWAQVALAPVPDGTMKFEGDGWGLGAYFGLNFDLGERHHFSLVGRLPISVDYEGDFTIDRIPAPGAAAPTSVFQSEIEHPGSIGVGYAFDISEQLTLGVDFEWIGNSSHDDLPLNIGTNQALLAGKTAVPLNWDDSISVGFGLEYECSENLTLRAGYLYSDSPMNDTFYNPSVPADDRHIISVGIGYSWDVHTIDFAYSFLTMDSSDIRGNVTAAFNGNYDYQWDILTLSYTRRF